MRIQPVLLFSFLLSALTSIGQVSIQTDGSDPDGSAMLDVKSVSRGMLVPRMTEVQRDAISLPAKSLLIYQTDGAEGYYYNSGTDVAPVWERLNVATGAVTGGGAANQVTYWSGPNTLTGTGNFIYGGTGNLSVYNAEASGGEVRLGAAWGRPGVYSSNGLHLFSGSTQPLYFGNDNVEYMRLTPSGNLAIGNTAGSHQLHVGAATGDGQAVTVRGYSNSPINWKGGAAFGYTSASVIMGELSGVAHLGGHNGDLSAWADLAINFGGGNVGIGTALPGQKLDVSGNVNAQHLVQGPLLARPMVTWSAAGNSTGAIIIKLPGGIANYGMLHMQVDVYEYGSPGATTYYLGGHNWNGLWYNYSCVTVGAATKKVRLAVKDGQYAIVLGETGSVWSYGHVVLSKITTGGYYSGIMNLAGAYSIAQDNSAESYTWITGDLNNNVLTVNNATSLFPNITGDNLGNHTATSNLLMSGHAVTGFGRLEPAGNGGNSGQANHSYAIFQEAGAWTHPYPDLRIAYHTGIKLGAHSSYNGIRFYNDADMATQTMSVGDGDNNVRVNYALYSPIVYDLNDAAFYLDPNATSELYQLSRNTLTRHSINSLQEYSPWAIRVANSPETGYTYRNGAMGWGQIDLNAIFSNWGGGIIDSWSNPANAPGGSTHYVGFQGLHANHQNGSQGYGFQMVTAGESENRFFWRNAWPNLRPWVEMIHTGNIGSYGDNLGNHTATTTLNMNGQAITNSSEVYTDGWFRNNTSGYGLYNQSNGAHLYASSGNVWNMGGGGAYPQLILRDNYASTIRGYVYSDASGFGLLSADGNWKVRSTNSDLNIHAASGTLISRFQVQGSTGALNLGSQSDPSNDQGNNWITWGERSDNNPYYAIRTNYKTYGSYTYSRLQLNWHTGIEIGGNSTYGGTRFFNEAPGVGATQIMSVGDGDNNIRVNYALYSPIMYDLNDANYYVDPNGTSNTQYWTGRAKAGMGLTGKYNTPRWDYTADVNYWTGAMGWGTTDLNTVATWGSGFFDTWGGPANGPGTTTHYVGLQSFHYSAGENNAYGWQMVGTTNTNRFHLRTAWNTWQPWVEMITTANIDNYVHSPWEAMGSDVHQICAGGSAATDYEWGVTYNNSSPVLRVTCNRWNVGNRVCTYPPYPTGDSEPFTWGGACWIWGTYSSWDDACSGAGQAYHSYYQQDGNGRYNMVGGNGCGSLPTVYRRRL